MTENKPLVENNAPDHAMSFQQLTASGTAIIDTGHIGHPGINGHTIVEHQVAWFLDQLCFSTFPIAFITFHHVIVLMGPYRFIVWWNPIGLILRVVAIVGIT